MSVQRDQVIDRALRDCEEACRRWCAECLRAGGAARPDRGEPGWRTSVLDASYVAAATARAIARWTDHDASSVLMLVGACAQIAAGSATTWRRAASLPLRDCITAADECAAACSSLLRTLVPRPVTITAAAAARPGEAA